MKKLSEEIDFLRMIADSNGWILSRVFDYRRTVNIYEYIDYKLSKELRELNITKL